MIRSIPTGFLEVNYFKKSLTISWKTLVPVTTFQTSKIRSCLLVVPIKTHLNMLPSVQRMPVYLYQKLCVLAAHYPPVFRPQTIHGRHYIDGQVTKSCDLELVVAEGARLVFIIDPLQPFTRLIPGSADQEGGLYGIIQTVKALISTRFETRLKAITDQFPDVDFMIFQPNDECSELMSGSPVKATFRTAIIDASYRGTLRQLRSRHHIYHTKLKRFGFYLKSKKDLRRLEDDFLMD